MFEENRFIPEAEENSSEALLGRFNRAAKIILRAHHQQGHREHAQMRVLAFLKQQSPMNQRELLEMFGVRSASLSELLAKLEQRGFITRSRDERDKRNIIISITEPGAEAVSGILAARKHSAEVIFGGLNPDERTQLVGYFDRIIVALEEHIATHHSVHDHQHHHVEHMHGHRGGLHKGRHNTLRGGHADERHVGHHAERSRGREHTTQHGIAQNAAELEDGHNAEHDERQVREGSRSRLADNPKGRRGRPAGFTQVRG